MASCGGDSLAQDILDDLLAGKTIVLPDVDFSDPEFQIPTLDPVTVAPITNDQLTEKKVDGDGIFDALMTSIAAHLDKEYKGNRIAGAEYTKAYIAAFSQAMANGTQFLLGRDQAYWQAVLTQAQAQTAQVQLVTARVQLETSKRMFAMQHYEALNAQASYALTTMKLATEDQTFCNLKAQQNLLIEQLELAKEQTEEQRSKTLNTRRDGSTVVGTVGKQKDLYSQQITSYQRDSEVKAAKFFSDAWITQKTIDEGLVAPPSFTNAVIDDVFVTIKSNNNL